MDEKNRIRVMIVDDHFVVRMGLAAAIGSEADMAVIAEGANGEEAIELYRRLIPDVLLMDLRLPGMSGAEAAAAICKEFRDAKVIVLSTFDGDDEIYRTMQAGARSYLLKSGPREKLLEAIRVVHRGERYLPPEVAMKLATRVPRPELSAREVEVLHLVVVGKSNKEIAAKLFIAEVTVKQHVSRLLSKLEVQDRTQLATEAIRRGIVYLD